MTSIIDKIDAAMGCQQCGKPLGSSPSCDFCSEECQREWAAKRADVEASPPGAMWSIGGMTLGQEASFVVDNETRVVTEGAMWDWIQPFTLTVQGRLSPAFESLLSSLNQATARTSDLGQSIQGAAQASTRDGLRATQRANGKASVTGAACLQGVFHALRARRGRR